MFGAPSYLSSPNRRNRKLAGLRVQEMIVHRSHLLGNFPFPEPLLASLAFGGLLHDRLGIRLAAPSRLLHAVGWVLGAFGSLLVGWATVSAREVNLEQPAKLITGGPYAFSRNPMYVGWTMVCLGMAAVLNSASILMASLAGWLYLDIVEIPREEEVLTGAFGEQYHEYCRKIRRYL